MNQRDRMCIENLILHEQERSAGTFIANQAVTKYVQKLFSHAEFVMHMEDEICVGFIAFYCNDLHSKEAFITLVLISEEHRGRGLASKLLKQAIAKCIDGGFQICRLEVQEKNSGAVALYKRCGFVIEEKEGGKLTMALLLKGEGLSCQ